MQPCLHTGVGVVPCPLPVGPLVITKYCKDTVNCLHPYEVIGAIFAFVLLPSNRTAYKCEIPKP